MKILNLTVVILNGIGAMKWTANKEEANKFLQTRLFVVVTSIELCFKIIRYSVYHNK